MVFTAPRLERSSSNSWLSVSIAWATKVICIIILTSFPSNAFHIITTNNYIDYKIDAKTNYLKWSNYYYTGKSLAS